MDEKRIRDVVAKVVADGRDALTEVEGLGLLAALDLPAPRYHFVKGSKDVAALTLWDGERAVVKVISPEILHKTEVGGVAIVKNDKDEIAKAMAAMEAKFTKERVDGYTINEFVPYEPKIGHEMIVGYRFAPDFGPVISFGPGGIYTEYLAKTFKTGAANAFFSPETADRALVDKVLKDNAVRTLVAGSLRNTKPAVESSKIGDAIETFVKASRLFAEIGITEFEVNPFVVSKGRLVALDVLVKVGTIAKGDLAVRNGRVVNAKQAARPVAKIDKLLKPQSAAVIGVSEKGMNNGRIILNNLIHNGFDTKRLYVVKPGLAELDGCKCVPDVGSLPEKVDLFVLVIPAAQAPGCIAELADKDKAESIIVIPGGLEEKAGTEALVAGMRASLDKARAAGGGPLINGGNCLGIRSIPGKYNTLFIPEYKLPMPKGKVAPVAVISQSGAFAICRISQNEDVNPKYVITCGNQMDVTIGDYLDRLKDDRDIEVYAVYVEGFKPLDGEKLLRAAKAIVDSGRTVIFYRAGRTAAGAAASASHTASIAGDYPVTRELLGQIGVIVAETLADFDDAVTLFTMLQGKKARGRRLGAISGAGFECVSFADNLGALELGAISKAGHARLEAVFAGSKISDIVDVHNPIDLTPMGDDTAYYESFKALLDDDGIDCGMAGIVPLTVKLNTLAKNPGAHQEDVTSPGAIAELCGKLMKETDKPFVASVDVGALYDPLVEELEARGVPVFRSSDRALKMLNVWLDAKLGK